ncbi:acyl-CoA synthetase [Oceanobacillus longus]|uniref:Acyl-CoA synthetase n=1 Tax=Oceanobacillus longus TaxID=930120 RepID=A0ABV8GZN2_9BACI
MKYEQILKDFSWDKVKKHYSGNPDEVFNMAHEACDRWAKDPDRIAIYWEDEKGNEEVWTYSKLKEKSDQMANALRSLGIKKGDRVAGLLAKDMDLVITILATWKIGAIYVPLFTAFGPDALAHRTSDSGISLLLTNSEQTKKLEELEFDFQILLVDEKIDGKTFWEFVDSQSTNFEIEKIIGLEPSVIQYTSGSTGLPKGSIAAHKGLYYLYPYLRYALDIDESDVFFGAADLGWSNGLLACTFGPLSLGQKTVVYKGPFIPKQIFYILEKYKVTNFSYIPTAYRLMMAEGPELLKEYDINTKKFSSAGEPLDAEVVRYFEKNFGRAIYDHYGATEIGMMLNNYNITDMKVKPGSMGLPLPGFKVGLINEKGEEVKQGEVGQIALAIDDNFEFMGYWNNEKKAQEKVFGNWILSGDLALQDEDGYFWFQGRADDVITSSGYRIGPTEVEATLMDHPAVLEAAVVGKADKVKGEIVKAFIVLQKSFDSTEELSKELSEFVKSKLSKHQYPREIEFIEEFPKTQSGKTQRFLLKQRANSRN